MSTEKKSPPSQDVIRAHSYDGIQEYDNPLPGWWTWIFYATILWSVVYVVGIALGFINSYEEDLAEGNAEVASIQRAYQELHPQPKLDAAQLQEIVASPERAQAGQSVYADKCASCHGPEGGGLIGPNLTDKHWISGGSLTDVFTVIKEGNLEKGMPAWGSQLKPDELLAVFTYVHSIQGTSPIGAKPPQGQLYEPPTAN